MLGLIIGVVAIILGLKGFSQEGLPLTSKKRLTGGGAKAIGVICILLGLLFLADGVYAIVVLTRHA